MAAFLVVAFHFLSHAGFGVFGYLISLGWTGVDAFFVLSGYLITGILYRQRGAPRFFRHFYIRRALRLFPLYYFIVVLALATSFFAGAAWRPGHVAFLFYGANIALIYHQSLGELGLFNLRHTWTLATEEQFYLVWPWIVGLAGSRRPRETLLRYCAAGIVLAIVLRFLMVDRLPRWALIYSLPARMDALLIGAALALIPLPGKRTAALVLSIAVTALATVVFAANTAFFSSRPMMLCGFTILGIIYASLLVIALHPETLLARFLSTAPLRALGKLSYGIYLWHYLLDDRAVAFTNSVLRSVHPKLLGSLLAFSVTFGASLLVASLSYRFLELPFLRLKDRFEPRPTRSGPSPIDS